MVQAIAGGVRRVLLRQSSALQTLPAAVSARRCEEGTLRDAVDDVRDMTLLEVTVHSGRLRVRGLFVP